MDYNQPPNYFYFTQLGYDDDQISDVQVLMAILGKIVISFFFIIFIILSSESPYYYQYHKIVIPNGNTKEQSHDKKL